MTERIRSRLPAGVAAVAGLPFSHAWGDAPSAGSALRRGWSASTGCPAVFATPERPLAIEGLEELRALVEALAARLAASARRGASRV